MNYYWVKFEIKEKGKPEYTEKNLAERGENQQQQELNPNHIAGRQG